MGAMIFPFPIRAAHFKAVTTPLADVLEDTWANRYIPLIAAAIQLLDLDDVAFEKRVAAMADVEGIGLVAELVDDLRKTSDELQIIVRAVAMTQTRLQGAVERLVNAGGSNG